MYVCMYVCMYVPQLHREPTRCFSYTWRRCGGGVVHMGAVCLAIAQCVNHHTPPHHHHAALYQEMHGFQEEGRNNKGSLVPATFELVYHMAHTDHRTTPPATSGSTPTHLPPNRHKIAHRRKTGLCLFVTRDCIIYDVCEKCVYVHIYVYIYIYIYMYVCICIYT